MTRPEHTNPTTDTRDALAAHARERELTDLTAVAAALGERVSLAEADTVTTTTTDDRLNAAMADTGPYSRGFTAPAGKIVAAVRGAVDRHDRTLTGTITLEPCHVRTGQAVPWPNVDPDPFTRAATARDNAHDAFAAVLDYAAEARDTPGIGGHDKAIARDSTHTASRAYRHAQEYARDGAADVVEALAGHLARLAARAETHAGQVADKANARERARAAGYVPGMPVRHVKPAPVKVTPISEFDPETLLDAITEATTPHPSTIVAPAL